MMKVGTLPWLLRHDLLLWWRGFNRKNTTLIVISFGLLLARFAMGARLRAI